MGNFTLTNYGTHNVSGAALKTAVDAVSGCATAVSGGGLYLVPSDHGQVQVIKVSEDIA